MGSWWLLGRGPKRGKLSKEEEAAAQMKELGLTPQLIDFVKGFTVETFKNFSLQDASGCNPSKDLGEWQERHAILLLAQVKEISQIRYALCPSHLKDNQFWKIYFLLTKKFVAPYEIHAMQKAKLKDLEKGKPVENVVIEVEMMESNVACNSKNVLLPNGTGPRRTASTWRNYDANMEPSLVSSSVRN